MSTQPIIKVNDLTLESSPSDNVEIVGYDPDQADPTKATIRIPLPNARGEDVISINTITDMEATEGFYDNQPAYLNGFDIEGDGGQGTFYWDANYIHLASDLRGLQVYVTGVSVGAWIRQIEGVVNSKWVGLKDDDLTDNLTIFTDFRTYCIDNDLITNFTGDTYYISSQRPDISGWKIKADPDTVLRFDDVNPNVKENVLLSDIIFQNDEHVTSITKHKNQRNDNLLNASGATIRRGLRKTTAKSFTDSDIETAEISGVSAIGAFTGTVTAQEVTWATAFTSNEQGVFFRTKNGFLYESAFEHNGTAISGSGTRGVTIYNDVERITYSVVLGQATARKTTYPGAIVETLPTLPNGGAYSLATNGSVVLGFRVVKEIVEFYINGTLIDTHMLSKPSIKGGFVTSPTDSDLCVIANFTQVFQGITVSSKPISIAIVGDSISYGAWASDSYDNILKKTMEISGIGEVTTQNWAVSGSDTADWISGGSIDITTQDFTGVDYCLIMLGTNDVQGGVSSTTYNNNLRAIINHVISEGVKPIVGQFPVWTQESVSGVVGVPAVNYALGGRLRQLSKYIGSDLGAPVAEVCAHFGTNLEWYGDNIHPVEKGQIAVASAFVEALLIDLQGGEIEEDKDTLEVSLTLLNSWTSVASNQVPIYQVANTKHIHLAGVITGGVSGTTIATLPTEIRPPFKKVFLCSLNDSGGTQGWGKIEVLANGNVDLVHASVTPFIVWLDAVNYILQGV